MLPSRFAPGQSSAMRKSRLEGKSMLPKPRRPGSTDRLSTEPRRPSTAGHRSSSAEPPRATFGGSRLSREASATKLPLNGRSRSQQGDRYGQVSMTPLRSSHYPRPTTTPVRTPSEERSSRNWQAALDRATAFVTKKDQRPISNVAWQRSELSRVQEALSARGEGGMALIRPLTIAKFVDITGALLAAITKDAKLNTDNYVTKLPHLSKRLLYPGTVSKSWLKTVNTLHAFPHALALIAYLLDLVNHIEMPVLDEWLYAEKDEISCLRRDYLYKCWIRFQDPGHQFEDLNEEYLQNLKLLLGNDEEKIAELQQVIKKYESCLEDEAEAAARADEARRAERRDALVSALRNVRASRRTALAEAQAHRAKAHDHAEAIRMLDVEIERANAESIQLKRELESQVMSVAERTKLLDEVDYANRVHDSKTALAEQIAKMVVSKENELALWQKKTLDSTAQYKQALIHLAAHFPTLAALQVDENSLMESECGSRVWSAVEALREHCTELARRRQHTHRARAARDRRRRALLDETRAKISEIKSLIEREQETLDSEVMKEASEASSWSTEQQELNQRLEALRVQQEEYNRVHADLHFWEKQDLAWRTKLGELREYIARQREETQRALHAAKEKRIKMIANNVHLWNTKLQQ